MSRLREKFAQRLKELRHRKKMTQEELATASGLSIGFIRSIEQAVNAPSFESLETLANILDVAVKDLFDFDKP